MKHFLLCGTGLGETRVEQLERQLTRERAARREAEQIAERGLRDLYVSKGRLTVLQNITENANQAVNSRDALQFALTEICGAMDWDFGNAYLVDRDTGATMACDCWYAPHPEGLLEFVELSRRRVLNDGSGVPGEFTQVGTPVWVEDVRKCPQFARSEVAARCGLVTSCCVPILIGTEVVALIEFFARRHIVNSPELMAMLSQMATQLGRVFERERSRDALLHDALHDALTGLPNRALMAERASSAFARLAPSRQGLAVLVVDLNGFKDVNDRHGHEAGNTVLVSVARRFHAALEECRELGHHEWHVTLARIGGDEFVVLIDGGTPVRTAAMAASALHAALAQPIEIGSDVLDLGAAIGIAESNPDYSDVDQILRDADLAMYEAKSLGPNATVAFTADLGVKVRSRMALEAEIRDAIRDEQFVLHYQPIFTLGRTPQLHGFEALVRWQHPDRGLVPPDEFIPTAEKTGLIVFLGDWVLREACAAMARLHRAVPPQMNPRRLPFIAINIAPQQFLQPNFTRQVREILIETGVPPACVKLEVTEGAAILNPQRTRAVLEQFRNWGMRCGLDDFGTGYSSLSYLHTMPFDTLKIDRSFIAALDTPKSRNIVRTILDLAGTLELNVVAEGIETPEQGEILGNMGCQLGQGYHFGRPLEESTAFALVSGIGVAGHA